MNNLSDEQRIFSVSVRMSQTVRNFVNSWPGNSFGNRLENLVLTMKDTENDYHKTLKELEGQIGNLEDRKKQLLKEVGGLEELKESMANTIHSLDKLQQVIRQEEEIVHNPVNESKQEGVETGKIFREDQRIIGQEIMAAERFDPKARHMIVANVLNNEGGVGVKGDKMRIFLSDEGYKNAKNAELQGQIRIVGHAAVGAGKLYYDQPAPGSDLIQDIKKRISNSGYKPCDKLVASVNALDNLYGKKHSMKEILEMYKKQNFQSMEDKKLVGRIAEECKAQELAAAAQAPCPG